MTSSRQLGTHRGRPSWRRHSQNTSFTLGDKRSLSAAAGWEKPTSLSCRDQLPVGSARCFCPYATNAPPSLPRQESQRTGEFSERRLSACVDTTLVYAEKPLQVWSARTLGSLMANITLRIIVPGRDLSRCGISYALYRSLRLLSYRNVVQVTSYQVHHTFAPLNFAFIPPFSPSSTHTGLSLLWFGLVQVPLKSVLALHICDGVNQLH